MSERPARQFHWFLAGQASWFSAFGIQTVLFPYLVVNVLLQGPQAIGIAQMAMMAPSLLLMLVGGVLADASDLRRLLIVLQLLAALPPLVLAVSIVCYGPGFPALVAYALAFGALQAFVLPARDALLNRVAGTNMQRAVTAAIAFQFGCQIVGFVLGGAARLLGAPLLLFVQALLLASGALATLRLAPAPPLSAPRSAQVPPGGSRPRAGDIASAIAEVFHSARIGPVVVLMAGVGLFFISVFMVLFPIMVRDLYHGSSGALALVNGAFVVGTLASTVVLMRGPQVARPGRAIVLALVGGATIIASMSLYPPQALFYSLIFVFGAGAGVVMSLGRTIVQEAAPPSHRARILAVYNLSFLGAAPIGAFALGQIAARTGVLEAALWAGAGMALTIAAVLGTTRVWSMGRMLAAS